MTDNFEFQTISAFEGYVSSRDKTNVAINAMVRGSQNVYKKLSGTVANRFGLKRRGIADGTLAGVKSSFEWDTSFGNMLPLRVCDDKLQVEFSGSGAPLWYDLLTGLQKSRFVFDTWWDNAAKKDVLLMADGSPDMKTWGGGIGLVASASNASGIISAIVSNPTADQAAASGGAGYVPGDILVITGGGGDARLTVDFTSPGGISSVSISGSGSGYALNDVVKVTGAGGTYPAYLKVTGVSGGTNVTSLSILSAGIGYNPQASVATTFATGSGTGLTVTINSVGDTITGWHLSANGTGYSAAQDVATTGGAGSAATVEITAVGTGSIVLSGSQPIVQQGFTSSGQILIAGTVYTYTATNGSNGNAFIGVTPDPSAIPAGTAVVQLVRTYSDRPNASFNMDFLKVIGNRVHCGSYNSRLIYISDMADFTNYAVPAPRLAGSPELLTLDDSAVGISVRKGSAHIGAGTSDWYVVTYSDLSIGGVAAQQTNVAKTSIGTQWAPLAHEFIDAVGDTIVYLSQDHQLRTFGDYRNIFEPAYPPLSQAVFDELQETDFTGGHLRAIGEFIRFTAPLSGADYMHQTRQSVDSAGNIISERLWHPPQIRSVSRFALIDGIEYGHSAANPQIYQIENTGQWHDDSPSGDPLPYNSVMRMAYSRAVTKSGARRQGMSAFSKTFFEGYMTQGTNLSANVYFNYQGSSGIQNVIINSVQSPAIFYSILTAPSLGSDSLGQNPLGAGLIVAADDQDLLPKFLTMPNVNPQNCFEYEIEAYSTDPDSRWEMLSLGANVQEANQQATFLTK